MATEGDDCAADTITASINYVVAPSDGAPAYLKPKHIDPVTGLKGLQNYTLEAKEVAIENVRGKETEFTLDNVGFQWVIGAPSKHTSFDNDVAIEEEYWPECIQSIKALTGASKVVINIYDHTVRRNYPVEEGGYKHGKPVAHVHGDQTPKAAAARVHRHLPASEAPGLLERRFQIINMWRPIKHAALEWPLALCDYRSLDVEKDLFPLALIYPKRSGETYAVRYNPNHKWRYLRGMTPADFVLIKNSDNLQDACGTVARLSPHTAFIDPTTPVDAPPRESIELRALVFYD
ncbi:hypothetical protein D9611_007794 [Ephemerocybe angulata]|uniref:Methyltransferase n=1 Tax=Ephemerocybe angulata TaxID=980116 RepID=A0A8H5CFP8_9AGAR|nr:hypothetical protein D9611_007794 [Tulosesus angulatus]